MQNPSGVSGQGPTVVIENASEVYIARNIIESHVHAAADEGYNDFQDAEGKDYCNYFGIIIMELIWLITCLLAQLHDLSNLAGVQCKKYRIPCPCSS